METPIGMNKTQDMVFDHAESICDSGEPVRRRVGAVGVLDSVVGWPWGPHNRFRRVNSVFIGFLGRRIDWLRFQKRATTRWCLRRTLRCRRRGPCSP